VASPIPVRMLPLYAVTIFLGAALLFLVQPMVGRMLLPMLGGSPAVWNTSMLFFQTALLGGYLYAHTLTRIRSPRLQALCHIGVMLAPLGLLPVADPRLGSGPGATPPAVWLLGALAVTIGGPFFVLSATGPLMQRWFARTGHRSSSDPYFLYAAGNAGSLLALVAYPAVLEPWLSLAGQRLVFSAGYAAFVVLGLGCAVSLLRNPLQESAAPSRQARRARASGRSDGTSLEEGLTPSPTWRTRAMWALLAFVPSSLMLGVTQHISTDVAAIPLLWVMPLSVYLLTFILAFSRRPGMSPAAAAATLPWLVVVLGVVFLLHAVRPMWALIGLHLLMLFVASMLCHGRLAASRPKTSHLTEFYLLLALGGAAGGVFNAILAPLLFNSIAEYPLALALALLLRGPSARPPRLSRPVGWTVDAGLPLLVLGAYLGAKAGLDAAGLVGGPVQLVLWLGPVIVLMVLAVPRRVGFALAAAAVFAINLFSLGSPQHLLYARRTFFGVHRVEADAQDHWRSLLHGTTRHGLQATRPPLSRQPTTYFHPNGPLGDVFDSLRRREGGVDRVAIVGLGAGSIAAYGRPRQRYTFYEIDPAVVYIARDSGLFTYLKDSPAEVNIVVGDARLRLAEATAGEYDLLILDAFSSDSIPLHLVTLEAVRQYLRTLSPNGLIAFHVTNRYLDLRPALAGIADRLGLFAVDRDEPDYAVPESEASQGKCGSTWLVMARSIEDLGVLARDSRWTSDRSVLDVPPWTDDYASILSVFRWR
jgi:SAM-dependent methyltransferase